MKLLNAAAGAVVGMGLKTASTPKYVVGFANCNPIPECEVDRTTGETPAVVRTWADNCASAQAKNGINNCVITITGSDYKVTTVDKEDQFCQVTDGLKFALNLDGWTAKEIIMPATAISNIVCPNIKPVAAMYGDRGTALPDCGAAKTETAIAASVVEAAASLKVTGAFPGNRAVFIPGGTIDCTFKVDTASASFVDTVVGFESEFKSSDFEGASVLIMASVAAIAVGAMF